MNYLIGNNYDDFINLREGQKFFFDGKNARIILLRKNPDEDLIRIIENNEIFFQIFLKEDIIFLLIKIDELKWIDIPFVANESLIPVFPDLEGYKCEFLFANPTSGKLYVKRFQNFSPGLSKALFWAVYKQTKNRPKNIESKINKVHAGFSSDEMARLSLGKH